MNNVRLQRWRLIQYSDICIAVCFHAVCAYTFLGAIYFLIANRETAIDRFICITSNWRVAIRQWKEIPSSMSVLVSLLKSEVESFHNTRFYQVYLYDPTLTYFGHWATFIDDSSRILVKQLGFNFQTWKVVNVFGWTLFATLLIVHLEDQSSYKPLMDLLHGEPASPKVSRDQIWLWHKAAEQEASTHVLDRDSLRKNAAWIRDKLDPLIARDGPDILCPDVVVTLFTFFEKLRKEHVPLETLRYSRIHIALLEIAGCASRWPSKLINGVDELLARWTAVHGPLGDIRPLLYEEGGRLYGVCTPEDLARESLLVKWLRNPKARVSPGVARRIGHAGFTPGDWWINAMFAYHAGIVDNGNPRGGLTFDSRNAYALLMTYDDELFSPEPDAFTYRARSGDSGRYRLTAANISSRQPVRVLRSHTLYSFWAPRAGIRYDGLYKVTGWKVSYDATTNGWCYDISFRLFDGEPPGMKELLLRPKSEELDDYKEYKRIRREVRTIRSAYVRAKPLVQKSDIVPAKILNAAPGLVVPREAPFARSGGHVHFQALASHGHHQHGGVGPEPVHAPRAVSAPDLAVAMPTKPKYAEGADDRAARLSVDMRRASVLYLGRI